MRGFLALGAITVVVACALAGCGSGSSSGPSSTAGGTARPGVSSTGPAPAHELAPKPKPEPGVGMTAPISKVVVARRFRAWSGRPLGEEETGSKGCMQEEGHGEINVYTDVPSPLCVRVTGDEPVLIVNRSTAYRRSEGSPLVVTLGPYRARILPQQAARFGPVGRFLGRGLHDAVLGHGGQNLGVQIEPKDCAIFRPGPGEPLCFKKDRAGRLRRWRRTVARMGAPACRGSDLAIIAPRHSGLAAGTAYSQLRIVNRSSRPCTVAGVPAVVAIGSGGKTVGRGEEDPGLRPGSPDVGRLRVKLAAGGSAIFEVAHADGGTFGACKLAETRGLRVSVPAAGPARFVALPMGYCPPPRGGLGLRVGRIE
jgi:Protein of unknown function (DUF4232)